MRQLATRAWLSSLLVVLGPVIGASASTSTTSPRAARPAASPREPLTIAPVARSRRHDRGLSLLTSCTGSGESISPCTPSATVGTGGQAQQTFTVVNNSIEDDILSTGCTVTGAMSSCSASPASISVPHGGASRAFTVTFTAGASAGSGTVNATATGNAAVTATITVTVGAPSYAVSVTPKGGDTVLVASSQLDTTRFTVQNTGSGTATFTIGAVCASSAFPTGCTVSPTLDTLAAGASQQNLVLFTSGGSSTTGRATVTARQTSPNSPTTVDTGWVNVATTPAVCTTSLSSISPCTVAPSAFTRKTGLTQVFILTNHNHLESVSYGLSSTVSGAVIRDSLPASAVIKADSSARLTVTYATANTPGTGSFTLTADDGQTPVTATATVTVSNPPPPPPFMHITVAPHYSTLGVDPGAATTKTFTLTNNSSDTATLEYSRSCTGAAVASGCTPATDTVRLAPGSSSTASLAFTANTTAGLMGSLVLKAWRVSDTTVRDSGSVDVTVSRGSGVVDIASVNAGSTLERSLCLSVSVARGISYECGDLRMAYALPATSTLTTTRTPVLLYNSRFAWPYIVIAANVTLPTDGRIPDSVSARLLDSAGVKLDSAKWAGSNWTASSTRRIALLFDPVSTRNYPAGAQRYTLEVTRMYGGVASRDTAAGEFFVVRRDHSQFGHGWWLAGLERLYLNPGLGTMFWVDGDGSARKYVRSPSNPNAWGAANLDRPDTVRRVGARFVRYLAHGLKVQFDTISGCHMETVNRLGQTTSFAYTDAGCGRLHTITLAPASANKVYTFSYASVTGGGWRLVRVDAPAIAGQARFDSLTYNASGQLAQLRDVYGDTLGLRYRASYDTRIIQVLDQRGDTLAFAYAANTTGPLATATIPLAAGSAAVTHFTPAETRGLQGTAAVAPELAYAKVDGPRTDVGDSTLFWLDGLGEPVRIRNAVGDETVLTRANATWPAAVTRVRYPSGQVLGATYDNLGHVASVTDSSTWRGSPRTYATTSYTWDPAWDFVTTTIRPEGDSSTATYDATDGNTLTETDGAGHQVTLTYYPSGLATALLWTVQSASGARDSLGYDNQLGNLARTVSPLGIASAYARDDAGRVVTDTEPNDSTAGAHLTRYLLDLLDRDTLTIDTAGTQALYVRQHFDPAGNLDTLWKWSTPDPNTIGTVKQAFVYDRANRKTQETLIGFQPITWSYDDAGNLIGGGRRPTNNTFDALNRRIVASGSETATFGYDAVGHLLFANNPYARIARAYNVNGSLAADTLKIATADSTFGDFTQHVYGIRSGYDLDGRRTWIKYPGTLAAGGSDSAAYGYDHLTGVLDTVRDVFGNQFRYQYDVDSRPIRLTRFAQRADSTWETDGYDLDSRLVRRVQQAGSITLHTDSLVYDRRGRVLSNMHGDSVAYSAFGALRYAFYSTASGAEEIADDALGNHASMWVPASTYALHVYGYLPGSDRLILAVQPSTLTDTTIYTPDTYGATGEEKATHCFQVGNLSLVHRREERDIVNDFNVQQQLIRSRYTLDTVPDQDPGYKAYHRAEFYRYDALGRRIWQRLVLDTGVVCTNHDPTSGCKNQLTRTVWDGDQVLYEIRAPGDTTGASQESDNFAGALYGSVGYTKGLGLDQPLDFFKGGAVVVPYTTWRGTFDIGTCPTTLCSGANIIITFPEGQASSYGDAPPQAPTTWWGGVITGQQDGSGYHYKRNRYYDAKTGRFTQEDPIGLAGGLNAYGFADGDPITYSDPFGLCPECIEGLANVIEDDGPEIAAAAEEVGAAIQDAPAEQAQILENTWEQAKAQLQNIQSRLNNLVGHVTEREHLSFTAGENQGKVQALKASGEPYDHVAETTQKINGVRNLLPRIQKFLSDPSIQNELRQTANQLMSKASIALDAMEAALR